ncbi:MAG: M20 family metallopeptidase [Pirellulaceae bacterium]
MRVNSSADPVVELTSKLVAFNSVSDRSNVEIAAFIDDRLQSLGFAVESIAYRDAAGIEKVNLVAKRGAGERGLAYFAHNDVVPVDNWDCPATSDPFHAVVHDGKLYGRGGCDMKGSLAAMLRAAARVDATRQKSPLWIVVTADEEVGFRGAKEVVARSEFFQTMLRQQPVGLIGEPTLMRVVHAHKGIYGCRITSRGKAGHSSTRDGVNAVLPMIPMLKELHAIYEQTESDAALQDKRFDPPTLSWNIGLADGGSAINVTPARCQAWVSWRTMPEIDAAQLISRVQRRAEQLGLSMERLEGCDPMWVDPKSSFVQEMVRLTGTTKPETVCYGTDGGVFGGLRQMVVCGPGDIAQAHTVDEWIDLRQLDLGVQIYQSAIERWCC